MHKIQTCYNNKNLQPELLVPAGSLSRLKTAILYGADAVYAGTPDLSLRTKSSFNLEELIEGVKFAHNAGKKLYLTLNLFAHNKDIEKLPTFLNTIKQVKPDGVIVADPGVLNYVKKHAPQLPIHISTQANICSYLTVNYWQEQGAELCVLAREVSFKELSEIREKCPDIKLEAFIHGAMCMTYSGRCLLSNFMSERGANQGNCAHSCRWKYKVHAKINDNSELQLIDSQDKDLNLYVQEEYRPDEYYEILEDERGSYIFNSKDLCLMPVLDEYLKLGIDSLKIEGRNKSEYYAAIVTRAYRNAIDEYYENPEKWRAEKWLSELYTLQNRGYTMGFHHGTLKDVSHNYDRSWSLAGWHNAGVVREWENNDLILETRNTIASGDVLEFLSPYLKEPIRIRLYSFEDARTGKITQKVSAGQKFAIRIKPELFDNYDIKELKKLLPTWSVARKNILLKEDKQTELEHDLRSLDYEREKLNQEEWTNYKQGSELKKRTSIKGEEFKGRPPRIGKEGCCGRGCNGCIPFATEDKYKKAREKLKSSTLEYRRLTKEEASLLIEKSN